MYNGTILNSSIFWQDLNLSRLNEWVFGYARIYYYTYFNFVLLIRDKLCDRCVFDARTLVNSFSFELRGKMTCICPNRPNQSRKWQTRHIANHNRKTEENHFIILSKIISIEWSFFVFHMRLGHVNVKQYPPHQLTN